MYTTKLEITDTRPVLDWDLPTVDAPTAAFAALNRHTADVCKALDAQQDVMLYVWDDGHPLTAYVVIRDYRGHVGISPWA